MGEGGGKAIVGRIGGVFRARGNGVNKGRDNYPFAAQTDGPAQKTSARDFFGACARARVILRRPSSSFILATTTTRTIEHRRLRANSFAAARDHSRGGERRMKKKSTKKTATAAGGEERREREKRVEIGNERR